MFEGEKQVFIQGKEYTYVGELNEKDEACGNGKAANLEGTFYADVPHGICKWFHSEVLTQSVQAPRNGGDTKIRKYTCVLSGTKDKYLVHNSSSSLVAKCLKGFGLITAKKKETKYFWISKNLLRLTDFQLTF